MHHMTRLTSELLALKHDYIRVSGRSGQLSAHRPRQARLPNPPGPRDQERPGLQAGGRGGLGQGPVTQALVHVGPDSLWEVAQTTVIQTIGS